LPDGYFALAWPVATLPFECRPTDGRVASFRSSAFRSAGLSLSSAGGVTFSASAGVAVSSLGLGVVRLPVSVPSL